ncbi:MAG: hypothetical protein JW996_01160 [Candidatus Cloacimonetes bacterium]|nr:hypothetical protein [Candidatus Cloacimonadota bacterium]
MFKENKFIKADPGLKRGVGIFVIVIVVIALIFFIYFLKYQQSMMQLAETSPELALFKLTRTLNIISNINSAVMIIFAVYFLRLGIKILISGRFPLPGQRMIKDTKIRSEGQAKLMGWIAILFGMLMIFLSWFFYHYLDKLIVSFT